MYTYEFKLKLVVYLSNQTESEMWKYSGIRVFVLIMLFGLAYACDRKGVDVPELLQADSLMEEHPDSALVILERLTDTKKFSSGIQSILLSPPDGSKRQNICRA